MKQKISVLTLSLVVLVFAFGLAPIAFAEDAPGVVGCSAVKVDPAASMEEQQVVCGAAEGSPGSSCAASGSGMCSSPKTNDVLPEADHCICVGQTGETVS